MYSQKCMKIQTVDAENPHANSWTNFLNRPLDNWWCFIGWAVSSLLFFEVILGLGGPTVGDSEETVYNTWAISHGDFTCAYPPVAHVHLSNLTHAPVFGAPLYSIFAAGVAALFRIGHTVVFPPTVALGTNCADALTAIDHWANQSNAVLPTVQIGYLSWLLLLGGIVALLRTSIRGLRGWEPFTLVIVAVAPPVFMCILDAYHPQDLMAVGFVLMGVAFARRDSWIWAGVLIGLAITSHQFAVLVALPLVIISPRDRRFRFAAAMICTVAVVTVPLVLLSSQRVLHAILFGSSRIVLFGLGSTKSHGGTVLWELHLREPLLFLLTRLMPIALSMLLAWWTSRRLGASVFDLEWLLPLLATALSLRLVFEENLYGYYFMAVAVSLILLDVIRGRIRGSLVAWLALVTMAFNPIPWSLGWGGMTERNHLRLLLPLLAIAFAIVLIGVDMARHRIRWYLLGWLAIVLITYQPWRGLVMPPPVVPTWLWQLILVPTGIMLGAGSLWSLRSDASAAEVLGRDSPFAAKSVASSQRT